MTVENPTSQKVSNEELLQDIQNTEREISAYQMLKDGYRILAGLPETSISAASRFNWEAERFNSNEIRCSQFLDDLYALKAERGL
jgi:hypothetical protein